MSSDEFEPPDSNPDDEPFGNSEARPAVFVTTREPVTLTVAQLEGASAKGEDSALATYIGGRLVARSAMPHAAIERLIGLHLFDEPVRLGLFAYEEEPGLQCRLFALVPRTSIEAEVHAAEPWKASVPSYEALSDRDDDGDDDLDDDDDGDEDDDDAEMPFETILLGNIVRFERDRRHPNSLADEAVDILQRIIHGAESLEDADRKAIDDLLGSL